MATIIAEHDVLRLQVSVDDPFLVQMTQGHRDLSQIETSNSKKKEGKKRKLKGLLLATTYCVSLMMATSVFSEAF